MTRPHNYYAGPAALPVDVLEIARDEMMDFGGTGLSVMEISHRSKEYDAVHQGTVDLIKELMGLGDNYKVLLLQGGASHQFAMLPMNLIAPGESADYVVTGTWSKKAYKEVNVVAKGRVAATTEVDGVFKAIPAQADLDLDAKAAYCHITSNNTIYGTQFQKFPDTGNVPLIADMSSDILSRDIDVSPFGVIYAGAQKNLGPSGLGVVIIRDDMLEKCNKGLPTILSYDTHAKNDSLFNTPPTFAIYMVNQVLKWIKGKGGVAAIEQQNIDKGKLIYNAIDSAGGFYKNTIAPSDRSLMNVVFNLQTEDLEKKFVTEGQAAGFVGIKGHRSIGGIRISMYNATDLDSVKDFVGFMNDFASKNG